MHFVGQCSVEMNANVHWCCCVDQPGLIPDNVQLAISIPVSRQFVKFVCLIGVNVFNADVSVASML